MSSDTKVFVYQFQSEASEETSARVREVVLAVIEVRRVDNLKFWTVAATIDQVLDFARLSWLFNLRQLGPMLPSPDGGSHKFSNPTSGKTWSVPSESLTR